MLGFLKKFLSMQEDRTQTIFYLMNSYWIALSLAMNLRFAIISSQFNSKDFWLVDLKKILVEYRGDGFFWFSKLIKKKVSLYLIWHVKEILLSTLYFEKRSQTLIPQNLKNFKGVTFLNDQAMKAHLAVFVCFSTLF